MKNKLAVEVSNLTTNYGPKIIHDNISFSIPRNSICSLIGGSGSGKTTLLKALLNLLPPKTGVIKILDHEITSLSADEESIFRKRTSVLFQEGALFSGLDIKDNILFPLNELLSIQDTTGLKIVHYLLNLVGLDNDVAAKMPSDLSGGMKKRVGLARSIILEPEILFLDEPTSGLDPHSARNFDELIKKLQDQLEMTVIMISHDRESVISISDQIIALENKKIIANGNLSEILSSDNKWLREYFEVTNTSTETQSPR